MTRMWTAFAFCTCLVVVWGIKAVSNTNWEYKGQTILALLCAWAFVVAMYGSNARSDVEAYLYLNSIVKEETDMLNEAKKGILKDTPEIQDLSGQLLAHIDKLNEYAPKAKKWAKDFTFRVVFPDLADRYWESPDFRYEVRMEPIG